MKMNDTAKIFREATLEIQKIFGNEILVFNKNKVQLPNTFVGAVGTKYYKEFTRLVCKTADDVSFIHPDFYIALKKTPTVLLKVWAVEPKYFQDELSYTVLMLTNIDEDGAQRIVQSLPVLN